MNILSEFIRYCFAGGTAFVADFAIFLIFTERLDTNYLIANTLGFLVGLLVNYLLSIFWVFTHRRHTKTVPEFSVFAMIGFLGIILGNSGLWYFVEAVKISHIHAKFIVTILVLFFNFSMRRYLLFSLPSATRE